MHKSLAAAVLCALLIAGCLSNQKPAKNLPFAANASDEPVPLQLERLGFSSYGVDEQQDEKYGAMVLLGMNLSRTKGEVNRQVFEGFKALYNRNPAKDFYLIELSDNVGVLFFASRGVDLRAFARGEINASEWDERNKKTMGELYERIDPLLDPSDAQAFVF